MNTGRKRDYSSITMDIVIAGITAALLLVGQVALASLPNIEIVSFLILILTLERGPKVFWPILIFSVLEILLYGIGTWNLYYLYIWHILALLVYLSRKNTSVWYYSILTGFFGLFFGLLCVPVYFLLVLPSPATSGGILNAMKTGLHTSILWWISGLMFDVAHGVGNFVVCLVLYIPFRKVCRHIPQLSGNYHS